MYDKLLVAYDGSLMSREAIENAKFYASQKDKNVEVHIISVLESTAPVTNMPMRNTVLDELRERLQPQMDEIAKEFTDENVSVTTQLLTDENQENPGKTICRYAAENDIDIILIGSRGLGNIKSVLLGSVSKYVVKHANAHVFLIKE